MRTTRTRTTRRLAVGVVTAVLASTLAACGGSGDSTSSSASSSDHNDTDVAFATDMIPHHAQALDMVRMTEGRDLGPAVERLAGQIEKAQDPEISTMEGWLRQWGEDVPDTSDMSSMSGTSGMAGMMSGADMQRLDDASGKRFQRMWLRMMIEHHSGAVEMARTEQADGEYGPALDLAASIETSQTAEIEQMRTLLG